MRIYEYTGSGTVSQTQACFKPGAGADTNAV